MELHDIENKLNMLMTGSGRKIVFWYDDDAEYEEDIQNIHLADVFNYLFTPDAGVIEAIKYQANLEKLQIMLQQNLGGDKVRISRRESLGNRLSLF